MKQIKSWLLVKTAMIAALFGVAANVNAEDKVCFIAPRKTSNAVIIGSMLGGAIGGAIAISSDLNENPEGCYIMDSNEKKVKQIKAKYMSALLAESPLGPGLYEAYDKESKESAEVIIRQLKKLDLLKPY